MSAAGSAAQHVRRRLYRHLHRYQLLDPTHTVLVALSGGLDSVCLLHLLRFAARRPQLVAAHLDHGMRPDSGADADWVRGLCRAWSVPLLAEVALPAPRGEADARARRYAFLERAADEARASHIVTAHHADDQAETVLFRLIRGTGLTGLAGIAARRGRLVRPLLSITRADLLAYARAYAIVWREDRTNRELRYARNRIRHQVLPVLEAIRPGATRHLARLAGRAAQAESGWSELLRDVVQHVVTARDADRLTLARERLLVYHPQVRARVLRQLLHELGSRPGRGGTRVALDFIAAGASGTRVELAGGVTLSREFEHLRLARGGGAAVPADVPLQIRSAASGAGSFQVGGRRYLARWQAEPGAGAANASVRAETRTAEWAGAEPGRTASFDASALRFPLDLRGWRPGDRMRFSYGRKKLKELFRARGVGRAARSVVPVLADADGAVLWVMGLARAPVALPADADNVFSISVADDDSP